VANTIYPSIAVGQRITADLLTSMLPQTVYKSGTTSRSSTTTLADDPDLVLALPANAVGLVEFFVKYGDATGVLIKTDWNQTGISSVNRQVMGAGSTASDGSADNMASHWGVHGFTTTSVYGTRTVTGNQLWLYEWSFVTVGAANATVAFQWAQNASSATAISVVSGSFARWTRYA
jgi:hypothetical protein